MTEQNFIIDAWNFDNEQATKLDTADSVHSNSWYHFQRDEDGLYEWMVNIGLEPALVEAVLAEDTRPRFQKFNTNDFMLILRGVNLNPGEQPDDMLSLRILFYKNTLFTFRKFPFRAINIVRQQLIAGDGPTKIEGVLFTIIEQLHLKIEEVVLIGEQALDELQESLEFAIDDTQKKLTNLHRQLLRLNRFIKPQTHALADMGNSQISLLQDKSNKHTFLNQKDAIQRILEGIDANLDHAWVLREHIQQRLSERMNANTYRLSLFAGIFMPLGFLTGLLGVNLGGIPGSENGSGFMYLCLGLAVLGVGEYLVLRRLKYWQ